MEVKKIIALYLRISKRDAELDEDTESNSIHNQREILREYVKRNLNVSDAQVREFIDDGYSGTSFQRPALLELLRLAEEGLVYAIIVKDLSRFARNYIGAGSYIERIFPYMGVRFICVNDQYDSENMAHKLPGIDMAFKGIIHDYYCKELSGKLKNSRRQQVEKGKCIFSKPPYGYWKSGEEKGKLIVDEETAPIVKRIFESFLQGDSSYKIAKDLNAAGVDSPNKRLEKAGLITFQDEIYAAGLCWSCGVVLSLLRNRIYIGDMVGNKEERIKMCEKKCRKKDKEEWIIVEATHEPIIERELFFLVQQMLGEKKTRKPSKTHSYQVFKGKLTCSSCHSIMTKSGEHKRIVYYTCTKCRTLGRKATTVHSDFLEKAVLEEMPNHQGKISVKLKEANYSAQRYGDTATVQKKQTKSERRADRELLLFYERYAEGLITKEEYEERRRELQELQQMQLREEVELTEEREKASAVEQQPFAHEEQERLTQDIVEQYIDKIMVFDREKIEIMWQDEKLREAK